MKWFMKIALFILLLVAFSGCGRIKEKEKGRDFRDYMIDSPMVKLMLPDGTSCYLNGFDVRSLAGMPYQQLTQEPADQEDDWIYRIIYNPSEVVQGSETIVVSFYEHYMQINEAYYTGGEGVSYEYILEWAKYKFDYFMEQSE